MGVSLFAGDSGSGRTGCAAAEAAGAGELHDLAHIALSLIGLFLLVHPRFQPRPAAVNPFHKPEMDRSRLARRAAACYTGLNILCALVR